MMDKSELISKHLDDKLFILKGSVEHYLRTGKVNGVLRGILIEMLQEACENVKINENKNDYKSSEQLFQESPYKRIQTKEGKWNLELKLDQSLLSDIWFDNLIFSGGHIRDSKQSDDIFWDGLVFLEEPIKCSEKSAYPYSAHATCYHYNGRNGILLSTTETTCGIWGYGYNPNVIW